MGAHDLGADSAVPDDPDLGRSDGRPCSMVPTHKLDGTGIARSLPDCDPAYPLRYTGVFLNILCRTQPAPSNGMRFESSSLVPQATTDFPPVTECSHRGIVVIAWPKITCA